MARKPKRSIDFAGWRTDIFENDTKIDELIEAQGWIGFAIYFYLCQKAYASDGYFYRWSYANAATTARRMGGGIGSETIRQVVGLCLQIGLFDKRLFDRESILTSKGIQRHYMIAIQKRAFKEVEEKLWLLNEEESEGVIVVPENRDSLPENADSLPENATKESKVKESKVKESKGEETASPDGSASSPSALEKLIYDYGQENVDKYVQRVRSWYADKGKSPSDLEGTVRKWLEQDGIEKIDHSIDKYNCIINKF
jgi:hypothetical protein